MPTPPRWITVLHRMSQHRRDAAMLDLRRCVAESESLRQDANTLTESLAQRVDRDGSDNDSKSLNLARLRRQREDRDFLLAQQVELQSRIKANAQRTSKQIETLQQREFETQKLERLTERVSVRLLEAKATTANRELLENLAAEAGSRLQDFS